MFIRITLFGGIIPRIADRGLPDNAAQFAMNAKLYSGELRAWSQLKPLASLSVENPKTVFHYRDAAGEDKYLPFPIYTNVVKAPLVNETLRRLYWTNATGVFISTAQRIADGDPPFALGVPQPEGTFSVVPTGGTAQNATTRVYTATLGTSYGEESAPGKTVSVSGNTDGTWTVNGLNTLVYDELAYPNVDTLFLYRTISSDSGVDYRRIAEWPIDTVPASYLDNTTDVDAADNFAMQSLGWATPPENLQGLIGVAGGYLAGFVGRSVRLSVPYQPHAWPEDYQYTVEDDIVGLGTFGNTIVVCTEGRGYLLIGPSPDAMSLMKMESVQPCLSPRSIVSTVAGVMYASTDGIVLIDGASNTGQIVSKAWVTKTEWMSRFFPSMQMAAVYQDRYFAFYSGQLGFTVGFDDPVTGFTELQQDGVSSVDQDALTGQTLVSIGDYVYEWDGDPSETLDYQWKSKPFVVPKPVNMAALQVRGEFVSLTPGEGVLPPQGIGGYAINTMAINGTKQGTRYGGSINGAPTWQALGLDPSTSVVLPGVAVKVYADGVLRWFGKVTSEQVQRLPSGFKATHWEVELQGGAPIYSVVMATTAKELEQVP